MTRCTWFFSLSLLAACSGAGNDAAQSGTTSSGGETSVGGGASASTASGGTSSGSRTTESGEASSGGVRCPAPGPAVVGDIVLPTPTGDLFGTYLGPEGCGPFPTVLFHVGSGATDRDGNTIGLDGRSDGHLQLAEALQSSGIASVRFDKRGIAQSEGAVENWEDIVVETYADDLVRWVQLLRQQRDVVGDIVVLGHSEGALISTIAATEVSLDALVLVAGPGRSVADILRTQLEQNLEDQELLDQANAIIEELENGNVVDDVPPELLSLFAPSVQPLLISLFARDPAEELMGVSAPTTIIGGTADIQVPVFEAEVLAAAKPDAELRIIENMTHVFKDAAMGQDAAYTDPDVPLAAGFVEAVVGAVSPQ